MRFSYNNENAKTYITIALALSSGFISSIGFGLLAPLFSLRMDDLGLSAGMIGVLVTIAASAPLFLTPLIPKLLSKIPTKNALFIAIIINMTLYCLLCVNNSPLLWTIIRFCFSITGTFLFIASESWILELAPPNQRGKIFGLYAVIFYGGIGIGGLLISQFTYKSNIVIYIAILLNLIVLPFFVIKTIGASKPHIGGQKFSTTYKLIFTNLAIFMPAFAIGGLETAAFNLFPIWSREIGFDDRMAGAILGAAAIGNIILQFPIGALADKIGRNNVLKIIALAAVIMPLFLINTHNSFLVLAIICIWSGFVTGFYTMGLVGIAEYFEPQRIALANAAFGTTYCIAQLIAPSFGGTLMQFYGSSALLISLSIIGILPLIMLYLPQKGEKHS